MNISQLVYLFLDFDGVLHPFFPRNDRTSEQNQHFSYLPKLEQVLRLLPQVRVVISSSWRRNKSFQELQHLFSEDVRTCIIDVTPVHSKGMEQGGRQGEIEQWMRENAENSPWVALDDMAELFEENAPLVVAPDGLESSTLEQLQLALTDEQFRNALPLIRPKEDKKIWIPTSFSSI